MFVLAGDFEPDAPRLAWPATSRPVSHDSVTLLLSLMERS